jgi:hypothetical protein
MIVPLILAGIRGTLAAVSLGAELYDGAKRLWRGKGPLPGAQGESQPLPFSALEHQRAQMQAATNKGTVQGPTPAPVASAMPDTVRSFPPLRGPNSRS